MVKHPAEDCLPENKSSITPLHNASSKGHAEIIRSLRRKIDFEFINQEWFENSLQGAIEYGHLDCVKALLEKQTSNFKKNLADEILVYKHYMNKDTGKYEDMNVVDTAKHYYSITKNQNHYKIVEHLSQVLK